MSLTVKAFFKEEIRRFGLDVANASSFAYLEGKLRASFQNLPPKGKLLMKWKDSDGDLITFSTDEELVEALSSAENGVFKVHLEKRDHKSKDNGDSAMADVWISGFPTGFPPNYPPPPPPAPNGCPPPPPFGMPPCGPPPNWGNMFDPQQPVVHQGVTCDGCETGPIVGIRFKCKSCPDYDLCSECKSKGITCGNLGHEFEEITQPRNFFWRPPGPWGHRGPRCGRRGKFPMFRKFDGEQSSGEEGNGFRGPLSKEEREKLQHVIATVKEAAKTQAYEVGGATAGDCAGDSVVVAVRSSIRRALIVQKRSGLGLHDVKKKHKKHSEDTSSSDDSDVEYDTINEAEHSTSDKKGMKRKAKTAAKVVSKVALKEVSESFGKLAGKWAAQAVRQTMIESIKQCMKAEGKREKKNAKKERKQSEQQPMEGVSGPVATTPQPLTMSVNNVPIYPVVAPTEHVSLFPGQTSAVATAPIVAPNTAAAAVGVGAEEQAIMDAITAFKNMGFTPDEKLVDDIRKAKGDITKVFDQMKK